LAEILRQPIFGNPLITNPNGKPLGYSGKSEGNALANAGRSRIRDFWDPKENKWKDLPDLGVSLQTMNRVNRKLIIESIPWNPATANEKPIVGDWVSKKEPDQAAPPDWIYQITNTSHDTASAKEYKKLSSTGRIKATSSHDVTIPLRGYERVRVLEQERHGATLRLAKGFPPQGKNPRYTGYSSPVSYPSSNGTPVIGTGSKKTILVTPFSSATRPRGDPGTREGNNTPLASSPSSNT
jgi:hypothetical protein